MKRVSGWLTFDLEPSGRLELKLDEVPTNEDSTDLLTGIFRAIAERLEAEWELYCEPTAIRDALAPKHNPELDRPCAGCAHTDGDHDAQGVCCECECRFFHPGERGTQNGEPR